MINRDTSNCEVIAVIAKLERSVEASSGAHEIVSVEHRNDRSYAAQTVRQHNGHARRTSLLILPALQEVSLLEWT